MMKELKAGAGYERAIFKIGKKDGGGKASGI